MEEETFWHQRFMRLETFNKILKAATSSAYLNTAFVRMSEEIRSLLQHDRACIMFASPNSEFAVVYGTTGEDGSESIGLVIPLGTSHAAEAIRTGVTMTRSNIAEDEDFPEKESLLAKGIRSNITVPIWRGEAPRACICFSSFEIDKYGDAEVQMAEEIADLVGDILTQSRDMQELLNLKSAHLGIHDSPLQLRNPLTTRETQVHTLLAEGEGSKGIAGGLGIHPRTVRSRIENIYQKLGVQNRVQALREAHENHLINI